MAQLQGGPIHSDSYTRSSPESTPLPPGVYRGIPVKTEQKDTAGEKGPGVQVVVEFDITHPEDFSNRKFWDRFNVMNPSADTVRIAKEGLADLAKACGIHELNDDEQLLGNEVILELSIEKGKPYKDKHTGALRDGKDSNKCRKYWPLGTDVDAAKKTQKTQVPTAARAAPPQGATSNAAQKWGGQKPVSATPPAAAAVARPAAQPDPVVQASAPAPQAQAAHQPAASTAPAGSVAPWKRNKQ